MTSLRLCDRASVYGLCILWHQDPRPMHVLCKVKYQRMDPSPYWVGNFLFLFTIPFKRTINSMPLMYRCRAFLGLNSRSEAWNNILSCPRSFPSQLTSAIGECDLIIIEVVRTSLELDGWVSTSAPRLHIELAIQSYPVFWNGFRRILSEVRNPPSYNSIT